MEKLTRWTNVRTDDLCRVEDPFFSVGIIRGNLQSRSYVQEISGVTELLRECGLYGSLSLTSDQILRSGFRLIIKSGIFRHPPPFTDMEWSVK